MNNITYIIIACYPDRGMKSYGSKSLISFNNQKLLDYQIECVHRSQSKKNNYEIIVVCDFEITKISKTYNSKIKIVDLNNTNPIYRATEVSKYDNILFIDYGCIFEPSVIKNLDINESIVLCTKDKKINKLDIGCIVDDNDKTLKHMFFDLPDNKFCNMFFISSNDTRQIKNNQLYKSYNLLYFEIINYLNQHGSKININYIGNNKFIYFNDMRQKNGISKFIKNSVK